MVFYLTVSLHAKTCCDIVALTKKYSSSIFIIYKNKRILANDVLAILSLSARQGEEISVDITGVNACLEIELFLLEFKKII